MRTITTAALLGHAMPDTDTNHYQHQQYHRGTNPEPSWMHEQAAGEAAGAAAQPYPSAAATSHTHQNQHETTPLRGSAPSSVASSAGRPSKHGAMYRPYLRRQDIRRGCCLSIFLAINAVCVLSALSVAVAEILSIVYHGLSPLGIAIRVYGIVFSIGVVFTELGWTQAVRDTWLLQNWISRGAIYTFVGLLSIKQEVEHEARINIVNVFIYCAGLGLIGLGVLYFVMGVFCLKGVRDRRAADYTILKSQAELEEALRRHGDVGKDDLEDAPSTYQAGGGGGFESGGLRGLGGRRQRVVGTVGCTERGAGRGEGGLD
ncbi:Golgi apparatus membrane protein TVP15 [Nannochloropsis gaditana]|uniref:Golgi apparatus membrane protein TVP15 n=1 Tax=Nannochloropsis gaditana TaxID=72520 RepID=W7TYB2_9STRA|nr:Golgi apparatus membrane protein TVP15 [Nannochloropsis gaditana]